MRAASLVGALLLCVSTLVLAEDVTAERWYRAPDDQKRAEVARVLGNIGSKPGCRVKLSTDYYVRALNAMLKQDTAARNLQFFEALALVATGAGENWCP